MRKKISIAVHNPSLSKAVQDTLFRFGYKWYAFDEAKIRNCEMEVLSLNVHEDKTITHGSDHFYGADIKLDAATEFGKLIELLEEKEKRIEQITTDCSGNWIHGTVAKDEAGKNYLQLSHGKCVHGDKIKEIYAAMFEEEK